MTNAPCKGQKSSMRVSMEQVPYGPDLKHQLDGIILLFFSTTICIQSSYNIAMNGPVSYPFHASQVVSTQLGHQHSEM